MKELLCCPGNLFIHTDTHLLYSDKEYIFLNMKSLESKVIVCITEKIIDVNLLPYCPISGAEREIKV